MPTEVFTDCWNCGHTFEFQHFEHCPRCGESLTDDPTLSHMIQIDPPNTPYLMEIPDMSPIFFEETPKNKRDVAQAKAAKDKYVQLRDTGEFPELIFVRSYVEGHRGWMIEFKHRNLNTKEYLLAPAGLKLVRNH